VGQKADLQGPEKRRAARGKVGKEREKGHVEKVSTTFATAT